MEDKELKSKLEVLKEKFELLKQTKYYNTLKYIVIGIVCICIGWIIANNSSTKDYNKLVDDYNELAKNYEENKVEVSTLNAELESKNSQLSEANEKVKNAEPWFKMSEEEQRKIEEENARIEAERKAKEEAERKAKEEEEARKQKEAEEEAARKQKEEEEAARKEEQQGYNTGITYDQLARDEQNYWFKKVTFKGKVLQVQEGTDENVIRLAVDGNYDKVLLVRHLNPRVGDRILDKDWITVRGIFNGLESYTSVLGAQITLPTVLCDDDNIDR